VRDRWKASHCRGCGKPREESGHFSYRGLCQECFEWRMEENNLQLVAKRGPFHDKWRAACRAAFKD